MSHRVRLALVIIAAAAVYLIGNDRVPLWDRDEPRNAQAARQMLESGDWVVPRFLNKVRTAKPPFTYWCQATAMSIFGGNAFAARLPSVVAMTLTLILLAVVLTRMVDADRAFWTVLILASSGIIIGFCARASMTDAVLLLWVTIAQLCLFAIVNGRGSWPVVILMAVTIALAGLTKGPVVLGVQATTLIVYGVLRYSRGTGLQPARATRHGLKTRATVKSLVAIIIIAAITAPWIYLVEQRAPGFLRTTTSHDVVQRVFEPLEQHSGPPGYYLLLVWGLFFPWSVLLPLTFVIAWKHRDDPRIRFALAAVIGPWLMFELVRTKLPHYLLPVFPALAYLMGDAIVRCLRGEHEDLLTAGTRGAIAVWSVIVAALGLIPLLAVSRFKGWPLIPAAIVAIAGVAYALTVLTSFLQRNARQGLIAMGAGMMVVIALLHGVYLPHVQPLRLSVCIADVLTRSGGGAKDTRPGHVQMIAYKEPSLAFYQGGTIREQSENNFLQTHPTEQWPTWVVIRGDVWGQLPRDVTDRLEVVGSCTGLALADKGHTWTVYVTRKKN